MSENSYFDAIAVTAKYENADIVERWFPPTRKGEPRTRLCEFCGVEYEVKSRRQKYCSALCRERAHRKKG